MGYFGSKQFNEKQVAWEAELAALQEMTQEGRLEMLLVTDLSAEERLLQRLMDDYRFLRYQIDTQKHLARDALAAYNEQPEDSTLDYLEERAEFIRSFTYYRKELRADITETRERVRWLKQQLKKNKQQQP